VAGSGVTGDLLAHCIDTAIWLHGGFDTVNAMDRNLYQGTKTQLTGKVEKGGIDDALRVPGRFQERFAGDI
jgi:myo-inositol 2-dehydrogenase/D-chiro-inositol 1-dehydrogenase